MGKDTQEPEAKLQILGFPWNKGPFQGLSHMSGTEAEKGEEIVGHYTS